MMPFSIFGVSLVSVAMFSQSASAADEQTTPKGTDLFQALDNHQVDVKFIAKSDHDARVLVKNNTNQPLHLQMPEAFAGVPALAQFGGGGGAGGGGGGGGFFSVPPEETAKIDVPVVCLNHGLREPNSSAAYNLVP